MKNMKTTQDIFVVSALSLLGPLASANVHIQHICLVFIEINWKRALLINTRVCSPHCAQITSLLGFPFIHSVLYLLPRPRV